VGPDRQEAEVKRLLALAAVVAALAVPAAASAHPLGNFTINRFSLVAPSGDRVYVLYVLDMAEIPTFQARPQVEAQGSEGYARRTAALLRRHLSLAVGDRTVALGELGHAIAFPPGQAGLRTTRLEAVYASGPLPGGVQDLRYRDANFAGRIGWSEVVMRADSGARLHSATVPATSTSDELRAYPKDLLQSPLDVTVAAASVTPGTGPGVAPATRSGRALAARVSVRAVADGGFAGLIGRDRLPVGAVLVSLLVATFWGAAHALSPGHGKSIIAAYLVGTRGTRRDAVVLGLTVTVTHTIGVFALGLITLSLSQFVVPEDLYPWLNLASALLVVGVGLGVVGWRLREWRGQARGRHHHDHSHDHDHGHHHDHGHTHGEGAAPTGARGLLGVGISGGLIPCPTALVVLLAAISLHRVGYGLVLILAFSVGLAATMTAIGFLAVTAKHVFERVDFDAGLIRLLPAVSALAILGLGVAMTASALVEVS
jgi:nickel/cobalt exporter